jgi:hypothetical protein
MTTVGTRVRAASVTAFVLLVTASWLTTLPAQAATPTPSSTVQPSPTPQPTTATAGSAVVLPLTLDSSSARSGDSVTVSFKGWKSDTCSLYYDDGTQPTGSCTATDDVLTGSLVVPTSATPNTAVPITACPTNCTSDNFIATRSLTIEPAFVTTHSTGAQAGGVLPLKKRPHHRRRTTTTTTPATAPSTSSRTTAFVIGGAVVVFLGSVLGLLLLRRRPPAVGQPPQITLVPHPDPGVVTLDPANMVIDLDARITIRLRPDAGRCRTESMQR